MQEEGVSKRYAKAILDLSIEQNSLDATYADMLLIKELFDSSREFSSFLKSPIIKKKTKVAFLDKLFEGKISELSQKFISILTRKHREFLLNSITTAFIIAYNNHKKITSAVVTTAFEIDESLRLKINELVKKLSTKEIELKEKIDTTIIGGFILQVGDKQVDASVIHSLSLMKSKFKKNLYKRQF